MSDFPVHETILSLRLELEKILSVPLPKSLGELQYGYFLHQLLGEKENSVGFLLGLILFCIENEAFSEAEKHLNLLDVEVASCAPKLRIFAEHVKKNLGFITNIIDTRSFDGITLQCQLLELLKSGPNKRVQLIEILYASTNDWSKAEKNFRQLLSRTRRNWQGIIVQSVNVF